MWQNVQLLLSYIFDVPVAKSEHNDTAWKLSLRKGRHMLETQNATYSYDDLYTAFSIPFLELPITQYNIKKVLILGHGMGSIVELLAHYFPLQTLDITAIEIDLELIHLYQTIKENSKHVHLIQQDAYPFILQQTDHYDLICIDLFIDNVVPAKFDHEIFMQKVEQALLPGGLCIWNRLNKDQTQKTRNATAFKKIFTPLFAQTKKLVHGDTRTWIGIK